jgi:hypothetical protein
MSVSAVGERRRKRDKSRVPAALTPKDLGREHVIQEFQCAAMIFPAHPGLSTSYARRHSGHLMETDGIPPPSHAC